MNNEHIFESHDSLLHFEVGVEEVSGWGWDQDFS